MISHMFPLAEDPLNGVFVREKARALSQHMSTTVVAPVSYFPLIRRRRTVSSHEDAGGVRVYHPRYLALPRSQFGLRWLPYYASLDRFLRHSQLQADVFFLEWVYPDAFAAVKYARRHRIKVVTTVHGHRSIGYFGPPRRYKYYKYALSLSDQVITVSNELQGRLIQHYAVPAEKISVIPNGIDPATFHRVPVEGARRQLGLAADGRVIVTVGRLSEEKLHEVMIRAFARSSQQIEGALYVIGDGPTRKRLESLAAQQGLQRRVFFMGALTHEKIQQWLCAADLFCLSSVHEGCPVAIHEALACGVPIVATRVGAVADLVCSSDYGFLCEPNDSEKLAALFTRALSKPWDREKISAYGQQFTWDKVARQYAAVSGV